MAKGNTLPAMLMCNIFTKQMEVIPIKDKRDDTVRVGMIALMEKLGGQPETIYTDKEPTVMSVIVKHYCEIKNIRLLFTETHAGVAEREGIQ